MQTFYDLESLAAQLGEGSAVTWGNFDGVHVGHQALIGSLTSKARQLGLPSVVMTFEPRPITFFQGESAPKSLTDIEDKLTLLARLGVDYALVLPFGSDFAAITASDFVGNILHDALQAHALVLGYDVSFGKGKKGDFAYLQAMQPQYGYSLEQVPPVFVDGLVVASTRVRQALAAGRLDQLPPLLGRLHSVHGAVTHGMQRGSSLLSIPTANLDPGPLLLPPLGVYACLARIGGRMTAAATSLGTNPSFPGSGVTLEAHLLDFSGNVYGEDMRLYFVEFLREEKAFTDIDLLKTQIHDDIAQTAVICARAQTQDASENVFPL